MFGLLIVATKDDTRVLKYAPYQAFFKAFWAHFASHAPGVLLAAPTWYREPLGCNKCQNCIDIDAFLANSSKESTALRIESSSRRHLQPILYGTLWAGGRTMYTTYSEGRYSLHLQKTHAELKAETEARQKHSQNAALLRG